MGLRPQKGPHGQKRRTQNGDGFAHVHPLYPATLLQSRMIDFNPPSLFPQLLSFLLRHLEASWRSSRCDIRGSAISGICTPPTTYPLAIMMSELLSVVGIPGPPGYHFYERILVSDRVAAAPLRPQELSHFAYHPPSPRPPRRKRAARRRPIGPPRILPAPTRILPAGLLFGG